MDNCDPALGGGMTQDEFIGLVQQELSVACALPFTVPIPEIQRIIKS